LCLRSQRHSGDGDGKDRAALSVEEPELPSSLSSATLNQDKPHSFSKNANKKCVNQKKPPNIIDTQVELSRHVTQQK